MNEFAYELIRENKIRFQSGNFFVLGFPTNLVTLTNISTFFHILAMKYGEPVNDIIKNVAKKQTKAIAYTLFNSIKSLNSEKIDLLLRYLRLFGYGDINIANINNKSKEEVFQIKNSTLCLMSLKLFGTKPKPGNAFVEGICAGIAELIFDCTMTARETDCVAMHKECCFIIASESSRKEKHSILDKYDITMLKTLKQQKLATTQAELIKKVSGHHMIEWNNGIFTVWGCVIFIIPTLSFIFLTKALGKEYGKEVNNILYHLARVQSRGAVYYHINKLGFNKDKEFLKSVLEHSDISGFGVAKLINADFKKHVISVNHYYNPYPFYIKELFGKAKESVDYYGSGLLAGAAEGFFGVSMENIEPKCVAKGNEYCFHESTAKGKETNYPLGKKYLKIIEEKVIPKNFNL